MYYFPSAEYNTCLFSFNFKGRTWFEKACLYISIESHGLSQVEKLKTRQIPGGKCSFKRQRPRLFYPFPMQSVTLLRLSWSPVFLAEGWVHLWLTWNVSTLQEIQVHRMLFLFLRTLGNLRAALQKLNNIFPNIIHWDLIKIILS